MTISKGIVTFENSFRSLVAFLEHKLKSKKTVSLPPDIIGPFHQSITPSNPELLKPLVKLFCTKNNENGLRLVPDTFYKVFAIIIQFPHSLHQEKLLHGLLETVALYQNEHDAAKNISRANDELVEIDSVMKKRHFMCRRLISLATALLQRPEKGGKLRQLAAQTILRLIRVDSDATRKNMDDKTSQIMIAMFVDESSYVVRLLLAEILRTMIHRKLVDINDLHAGNTKSLWDKALTCAKGSSGWIREVFNVLSKIDAAHAFHEREDQVFRLTALEFPDVSYKDANGYILAVISNPITFVLPATITDTISLIEVPINSSTTAAERQSTDNTIELIAKNGDRICQGVKKPMEKFAVVLAQKGDSRNFMRSIKNSTSAVVQEEVSPSLQAAAMKQSLMFLEMDWKSDDDGWTENAPDGVSDKGDNTSRIEEPASSPTRPKSSNKPIKVSDADVIIVKDSFPEASATPAPNAIFGNMIAEMTNFPTQKTPVQKPRVQISPPKLVRKENGRPSLVHFNKNGAANQGRTPKKKTLLPIEDEVEEGIGPLLDAASPDTTLLDTTAISSKSMGTPPALIYTPYASVKVTKRTFSMTKAELPAPKRLKFQEPALCDEEPPQQATPRAFNTIMALDMKDLEHQTSSFNDTTLLNEKEESSALTGANDLSEVYLEGNPHEEHRPKPAVSKPSMVPRYREIQRCMNDLAQGIISKLERERVETESIVQRYNDCGAAVLASICDRWPDKIEHEKKVLLKGLTAEKDKLHQAKLKLDAADALLDKETIGEQVLQTIHDRKKTCLQMLEAMVI